jgi:hypothetical protein
MAVKFVWEKGETPWGVGDLAFDVNDYALEITSLTRLPSGSAVAEVVYIQGRGAVGVEFCADLTTETHGESKARWKKDYNSPWGPPRKAAGADLAKIPGVKAPLWART